MDWAEATADARSHIKREIQFRDRLAARASASDTGFRGRLTGVYQQGMAEGLRLALELLHKAEGLYGRRKDDEQTSTLGAVTSTTEGDSRP